MTEDNEIYEKNKISAEDLLEKIFYYMELLVEEKDFQKSIELLTELGREIVGAERASLWYRDEEKGVYRTLVATGTEPIVVPKGRGIVGEAIEDNKPIISNIPYLNDSFYAEADFETGFTTHAILCVPITSESGHVIGAYQVLNKEVGIDEFDEQDANRLSLVAAYCGKTLEAQLLFEENIIDPLTGLKNRKGFYDFHDGVKAQTSSVIMCDIDFFKNVNDTYGHNAGDAVLVYVSDIMKKAVHELLEDDTEIFRWGGEEFIVFMPDSELSKAADFAEKLRERVEMAECYTEGENIKVTMSFGVSMTDKESDLAERIKVADNNLYAAKQQGRNKVVAEAN